MPRSPRRHPLRDAPATAKLAAAIGTHTAWALYAVVDQPKVDYLGALALVTVAYHADLMDAAGSTEPTYPSEVADMMGIGIDRAMAFLQILSRAGLLAGTSQAGYRLAGPMVKPPPASKRR